MCLEHERRQDDTSDRRLSINLGWDCRVERVGELLSIVERRGPEGRVYLEMITSLGVFDQLRGEKG